MKTLLRGVFMCPFDNIKEYPFDEEKCNMELKCNGKGCNHINLKPGYLNIFPNFFGEYRVLPINDTVIKIEKHILMVDILLGRNIGSIFMVTYLPTILMNIINQSANYVRSTASCEFVVTVNVTCMMVLASLWIS